MFQVTIQSINTVLERELKKVAGENEYDKGEALRQLGRFTTSLDKIREVMAPPKVEEKKPEAFQEYKVEYPADIKKVNKKVGST